MFTVSERVVGALLERTAMVLNRRPVLPRKSTSTSICPASLGARCHGLLGNWATVQPHEGFTSSMMISRFETLRTLKVKRVLMSRAAALLVWLGASQTSVSTGAGAATACHPNPV